MSFPASPKDQNTTKIIFRHVKRDESPIKNSSVEKKINRTVINQPLKWEMISRPPSVPTSRCLERKMSERSISSQMY